MLYIVLNVVNILSVSPSISLRPTPIFCDDNFNQSFTYLNPNQLQLKIYSDLLLQ